MTDKSEFYLGDYITGSLDLHSNINPQFRGISDSKNEDIFSTYEHQDPLKILGEIKFSERVRLSDEVIGTPVQEFYRDTHVLITGGTGFVGKLLTEKLVRCVPHLGHIYLLIRAKRGSGVQERFEQLLEDKVFRRMREEVPWYRSKLTAIAGDLSEPGLGLSAADSQLLTEHVQVVFHSAADVKFTDPLKVAIEANVFGSQRVLVLAKQMKQLKAYVHVSTAFSQCVHRVVTETVPQMNLPYKDILSQIERLPETDGSSGSETTRLLQGYPNTYTFSKALCEIMLQEEYDGLPLCIFRPPVIIPTYKEPFRGWTDNLYGPAAIMIGAVMGVLHTFLINIELSLEMVPADYVINGLIAAAWNTGGKMAEPMTVYNFSSPTPQRNWTWKQMYKLANTIAPWWPSQYGIWCLSFTPHTIKLISDVKWILLHKIPAPVIDKVLVTIGQRPRLSKVFQNIDLVKPSLEYFLFKLCEFKNDNMSQLWASLDERDKEIFFFDLREVNTAEVVLLSNLGIRYYYFKEKMDSIPAAERKYNWLYWIHNTVKYTCWLGLLGVAARLARALPL